MRNKLLSSVASSALCAVLATFAGGAIAADLATKAPPAPPMPAWSWAGFYAGVHDAAVRGRTTFSDPFGPSIFGDRTPTPGYGFGGQIGYNWQNGIWVYGLEADATWLTSDGTVTCGAFSVPHRALAGPTGHETFATLRPRRRHQRSVIPWCD